MTDWLLPLRAGEENEELRHALRSWVQNAGMDPEHDRLVTVGDRPSWLRSDLHLPGNTHRISSVNVYDNILEACSRGGLSDQILVVNDDFFAMTPVDPWEVVYRRPLVEHIRGLPNRSWWERSLRKTLHYLRAQGIEQPLSYELHRPFPCDSQKMAEVLGRAWDRAAYPPPQWRTLYGNLCAVGGTPARDGKVFSAAHPEPEGPWWSTTDGSWRVSRSAAVIRERFTTPTRWER